MADVTRQNFAVIGKNLDICEDLAKTLLSELFPETSIYLLEYFERLFDLKSDGDLEARRNKVIAAHRQRGGLNKLYFENIGNVMGDRAIDPYTVSIAEGVDPNPFIIHTYSPISSPTGPATLLPGLLYDPPFADSCYNITVTVTGVSGPENELEDLYNKIKPAWTVWSYVYV